ncbi:hypothetical protein SPI_07595 [Niveomyces insectorum RCEF 264]|uniref:2EXR domain-containing protein n=1 Tax=Niveomyces insectorum RCEF 264 TaxID=1081102 RepID=A0A167PEQ2_9HYPO|nr:hypothetical protein SPI_07595 [Niveomyces insectorum RCEF 264]
MTSQLPVAERELSLLASKLRKAISSLDKTTLDLLDLFDHDRLFDILSHTSIEMSRVRKELLELSKAASALSKTKALLAKATPAPAGKQDTFPAFTRLPTELRLLVWTAAAQPPLCGHYFDRSAVPPGDQEPAACFMPDRGLWTACWESRNVVQRAYEEQRTFFGTDTPCLTVRVKDERHYVRLGWLNLRGERFKMRLHGLNEQLRVTIRKMEKSLRKLKPGAVLSAETIEGLCRTKSGQRIGNDEIRAFERICNQMKHENLTRYILETSPASVTSLSNSKLKSTPPVRATAAQPASRRQPLRRARNLPSGLGAASGRAANPIAGRRVSNVLRKKRAQKEAIDNAISAIQEEINNLNCDLRCLQQQARNKVAEIRRQERRLTAFDNDDDDDSNNNSDSSNGGGGGGGGGSDGGSGGGDKKVAAAANVL